jgi:hypothetical protein
MREQPGTRDEGQGTREQPGMRDDGNSQGQGTGEQPGMREMHFAGLTLLFFFRA